MLSISSLKPNRYCSTDASRYTNRKNILSPVFIVFPFGTGQPEGLIDWALLAFIQVSNSMPDLLIQPRVGSDPDPLKLSSTVKKKVWMTKIYIRLCATWWVFVWSPKPANLSPSCDQFMHFPLLTTMYD